MPWKETHVHDLRIAFIAGYLEHDLSMAELCRSFGISRKTGYKFVQRYQTFGPQGLHDLKPIPHHQPLAVVEATLKLIIALRTDHPFWGPKKVRSEIEKHHPRMHCPAASTIGAILDRAGLVVSRKRRRRVQASLLPVLSPPEAPLATMTADFKGQFVLRDGQTCYPLTVCDAYSRMILRCQALASPSFAAVYPLFVAIFREYGLPQVIRTDNGAPFATHARGGLSQLSVWWIKLGILPQRIEPGHPQQNGRHERMHRVLKQEAISPPAANVAAQQRAFDHFVEEYNYVRPHQALGQNTPVSYFAPSPRRYPLRLPKIEYPSGMEVRSVRTDGCIRWNGEMLFVSETLVGEPVAFDPIADHLSVLYFGPVALAVLDTRTDNWLPPKQAARILNRLSQEDDDRAQNCNPGARSKL